MSATVRFDDSERRFLLQQRGIGDGLLARLEAMGIGSIDALASIGVDEIRLRLRAIHGCDAWGNRRRALLAAIQAAEALGMRRPGSGGCGAAADTRPAPAGERRSPAAIVLVAAEAAQACATGAVRREPPLATQAA